MLSLTCSASTNLLPLLLHNQQTIMTTCATTHTTLKPTSQIASLATSHRPWTDPPKRLPRARRQVVPVRTSLEWLGVHRRKVVSYRQFDAHRACPKNRDEAIISTEDEFSVAWMSLGYLATWTRQCSYGAILPSLHVYPVIEHFDNTVMAIISSGTLEDVQRLFASGKIHPHTRSANGWTLLHVSRSRIQMCELPE